MNTIPSLFQAQSKPSMNPVWLRIGAFLSTKAKNTQITYSGILKEWCQFLGGETGTPETASLIIQAKDLHAIAFRNWLESRPGIRPRLRGKLSQGKNIQVTQFKQKLDGLQTTQGNATIWKKMAALHRMYRVLVGSNLISENPFDRDRVEPPPKNAGKKRPTEMIDFELVQEIIDIPRMFEPKGLRDAALLAALFGGGLRRSEAASLRLGDVRETTSGNTYLYLRSTKNRKDAEQAIPYWAATRVKQLLKSRRNDGASDADYLFISYRGRAGGCPTNEPISHSGIYKLFKFYCLKAGANLDVSPHSARATAITKLLSDGVPHRMVQEFSRHSSVMMVELYDKRRIGVDENPGLKLKFKSR